MSVEAEAELESFEPRKPPRNALYIVVAVLTIAATLGMMLHIVINVALRTIYSKPLYGTLEYTQFWYVPLIAALGIGLAQVTHEHIEARLLFDRLPRIIQPFANLATQLLTLLVLGLFAYFGTLMAFDSAEMGVTAGVSGVVIWPAMFFLPVAFAATAIILGVQIIRSFRTWWDDTEPTVLEGQS